MGRGMPNSVYETVVDDYILPIVKGKVMEHITKYVEDMMIELERNMESRLKNILPSAILDVAILQNKVTTEMIHIVSKFVAIECQLSKDIQKLSKLDRATMMVFLLFLKMRMTFMYGKDGEMIETELTGEGVLGKHWTMCLARLDKPITPIPGYISGLVETQTGSMARFMGLFVNDYVPKDVDDNADNVLKKGGAKRRRRRSSTTKKRTKNGQRMDKRMDQKIGKKYSRRHVSRFTSKRGRHIIYDPTLKNRRQYIRRLI
jgi:hypothetical protein